MKSSRNQKQTNEQTCPCKYSSGFLRRPQKFENTNLSVGLNFNKYINFKSIGRFRQIFGAFLELEYRTT